MFDVVPPAFPLAVGHEAGDREGRGRPLGRVYGDPVEVWVVDGRPSRFVWNDRLYTVVRILERWVATRDWWREHEEEEPRTREFWRVEATPDDDVGIYELRHDLATGAWMLSRLWS